MPGPAPKDAATRRRNNTSTVGAMTLPRAGRPGVAPTWPLGGLLPGEREVWDQLWATPQAVAWEALGWTRVVARYAQLLLEAERPPYVASLLGEVRQLEDRLGLSPMACKRLQWDIVGDVNLSGVQTSSRSRLRVVD